MSETLIEGIRNNLPDLFPSIVEGANAKRRSLRHFGISKPKGITLDQVPLVEFPHEIDPVLRKVISKLGLALYYRHKGKPATHEHLVSAFWAQAADQISMAKFGEIVKNLTAFQQGRRRNLDFGDRFSYAWGEEEAGEPDIFVAVAKFGRGLVVCSMITNANVQNDESEPHLWLKVSDFSKGQFPSAWANLFESA